MATEKSGEPLILKPASKKVYQNDSVKLSPGRDSESYRTCLLGAREDIEALQKKIEEVLGATPDNVGEIKKKVEKKLSKHKFPQSFVDACNKINFVEPYYLFNEIQLYNFATQFKPEHSVPLTDAIKYLGDLYFTWDDISGLVGQLILGINQSLWDQNEWNTLFVHTDSNEPHTIKGSDLYSWFESFQKTICLIEIAASGLLRNCMANSLLIPQPYFFLEIRSALIEHFSAKNALLWEIMKSFLKTLPEYEKVDKDSLLETNDDEWFKYFANVRSSWPASDNWRQTDLIRNLEIASSLYTSFTNQTFSKEKLERQEKIQGKWKSKRGGLWDQWREVIGTLPDYNRWFSLYPVMAEEENLLSPESIQEERSWEKKKKELGSDVCLRNLLSSISSPTTSTRKLQDSIKLLKVLAIVKLWQQPINISQELSGKLSVAFAPSDDWKKRTQSFKDAAKLFTNTRFIIESLGALKEYYQNFQKNYEQGLSKDCFVPVAYATTLEGKRFTLPQSSLSDFRSLCSQQVLKAHPDDKQMLLSFVLQGNKGKYYYRDVNIGEEFGFFFLEKLFGLPSVPPSLLFLENVLVHKNLRTKEIIPILDGVLERGRDKQFQDFLRNPKEWEVSPQARFLFTQEQCANQYLADFLPFHFEELDADSVYRQALFSILTQSFVPFGNWGVVERNGKLVLMRVLGEDGNFSKRDYFCSQLDSQTIQNDILFALPFANQNISQKVREEFCAHDILLVLSHWIAELKKVEGYFYSRREQASSVLGNITDAVDSWKLRFEIAEGRITDIVQKFQKMKESLLAPITYGDLCKQLYPGLFKDIADQPQQKAELFFRDIVPSAIDKHKTLYYETVFHVVYPQYSEELRKCLEYSKNNPLSTIGQALEQIETKTVRNLFEWIKKTYEEETRFERFMISTGKQAAYRENTMQAPRAQNSLVGLDSMVADLITLADITSKPIEQQIEIMSLLLELKPNLTTPHQSWTVLYGAIFSANDLILIRKLLSLTPNLRSFLEQSLIPFAENKENEGGSLFQKFWHECGGFPTLEKSVSLKEAIALHEYNNYNLRRKLRKNPTVYNRVPVSDSVSPRGDDLAGENVSSPALKFKNPDSKIGNGSSRNFSTLKANRSSMPSQVQHSPVQRNRYSTPSRRLSAQIENIRHNSEESVARAVVATEFFRKLIGACSETLSQDEKCLFGALTDLLIVPRFAPKAQENLPKELEEKSDFLACSGIADAPSNFEHEGRRKFSHSGPVSVQHEDGQCYVLSWSAGCIEYFQSSIVIPGIICQTILSHNISLLCLAWLDQLPRVNFFSWYIETLIEKTTQMQKLMTRPYLTFPVVMQDLWPVIFYAYTKQFASMPNKETLTQNIQGIAARSQDSITVNSSDTDFDWVPEGKDQNLESILEEMDTKHAHYLSKPLLSRQDAALQVLVHFVSQPPCGLKVTEKVMEYAKKMKIVGYSASLDQKRVKEIIKDLLESKASREAVQGAMLLLAVDLEKDQPELFSRLLESTSKEDFETVVKWRLKEGDHHTILDLIKPKSSYEVQKVAIALYLGCSAAGIEVQENYLKMTKTGAPIQELYKVISHFSKNGIQLKTLDISDNGLETLGELDINDHLERSMCFEKLRLETLNISNNPLYDPTLLSAFSTVKNINISNTYIPGEGFLRHLVRYRSFGKLSCNEVDSIIWNTKPLSIIKENTAIREKFLDPERRNEIISFYKQCLMQIKETQPNDFKKFEDSMTDEEKYQYHAYYHGIVVSIITQMMDLFWDETVADKFFAPQEDGEAIFPYIKEALDNPGVKSNETKKWLFFVERPLPPGMWYTNLVMNYAKEGYVLQELAYLESQGYWGCLIESWKAFVSPSNSNVKDWYKRLVILAAGHLAKTYWKEALEFQWSNQVDKTDLSDLLICEEEYLGVKKLGFAWRFNFPSGTVRDELILKDGEVGTELKSLTSKTNSSRSAAKAPFWQSMGLESPTEGETLSVDFTKSMPQLEKLSIVGGIASENFLCSLNQFSQQLQKLYLCKLELTTLRSIPQLSCLIFLDLTDNKITSLEYLRTDRGQKKFPLLQVLRLQRNCLTHKEEARLDLLTELPLKGIDLSENLLEEVPKLGTIVHQLNRLDLRMNDIPSTIISKYEERKNVYYLPQREKNEVKDNL